MKLALTVDCWQDEQLIFAEQFGVTHVVADTVLPEEAGFDWDARTLFSLRNRVEKAGLILAGIDRLPHRMDVIVSGGAGRDAELDAACQFVCDAGKAGIPFIGYVWRTNIVREWTGWRVGRGGVRVRAQEGSLPGAVRADGETHPSWENLTYFLDRLIPVAEEAGVQMACRPSDPLTYTDGQEATLGNVRSLERVLQAVPSPANVLDFWPCALEAMEGADPSEAVRVLNATGGIALVTVQNLHGRFPEVAEACIDEGDTQMLATLCACRAASIDGILRPGPQPAMTDDSAWGHMAQAFAVGYLRSLLQEIERLERMSE